MTLRALLTEAQGLGYIGPADLDEHVAHAHGFAAALVDLPSPPGRVVDLGTGGGLPALVLANEWPSSEWRLVEANERRAGFLEQAVVRLGWDGRVQVVADRAEVVARTPELRRWADVVTARGFGAPAVTAECGAPFLRVGGRMVVSEPPISDELDEPARWPPEGVAMLGLAADRDLVTGMPPRHYQVLRQVELCPDRYPRRVGQPAKRPLFGGRSQGFT
jgi:16S rRNA (guanine527-N7)-methyltransferase